MIASCDDPFAYQISVEIVAQVLGHTKGSIDSARLLTVLRLAFEALLQAQLCERFDDSDPIKKC